MSNAFTIDSFTIADGKRTSMWLPPRVLAASILLVLAQAPSTTFAAGVRADSLGSAANSANEVSFNTRFGGLADSRYDLARLGRKGAVPGVYRVDVYVNDTLKARKDVEFRGSDSDDLIACLDGTLLTEWGVAPEAIAKAESTCTDVGTLVANANATFDPAGLRLDVSIPQADLSRTARGYVDPALWDAGMTAATLGYTFNANAVTTSSGPSSTTVFTGLDAGLNEGGWRLRGRGSLSWSSAQGSQWQGVGAFAQHDVQRLRSQFTVGDGFTSGELFASAAYRGANLASDDRMLPDSRVGYAPVVRGTAQTRARVEIRQNDFLIYETTVAPGAFEIDDLYATGHSGDLEVRVIETDGTVRSFTVPYAAVPRLLRAGASRYSATVGKLRGADTSPAFAEATYQRGLNNWLTGYAGVQATEDALYRGALLGAAVNTRAGALSWDVAGAWTKPDGGESLTGYSTRLTFSKAIPSTRTNLALAGYRYSTGEYLELAEAAAMDASRADVWSARARVRDRLQLSFSQQLGQEGGVLFASGSRQTYRDGRAGSTSYQLGYNNRKGALAYNVGASRTLDEVGRKDDQLFVSFSMPLGNSSRRRAPTLSASASFGGSAGTSLHTGLNGQAGSEGQFNYAMKVSDSDRGGLNADAGATWQAPYALLGAGYGWSKDAQQASFSASGGLVAHKGGITLAQRLGETIGVAEVKGAAGASLADGSHAKVDRRGYVVASDLRPYRVNTVELDPKGMSLDVELGTSQIQAVPRAGAVVPLQFDTKSGHALLVRAKRPSGEALPFGASVIDDAGQDIGLVGQGGQLFARRAERAGRLQVRWGHGPEEACVISYELPEHSNAKAGITEVEANCL